MKAKLYIRTAGLVTLIGMGGVGVLCMYYFQDKTPEDIFFNYPNTIWLQIIFGAIYGVASSLLLYWLLKLKMLDATKFFFSDMMRRFKLNTVEIIFISFCAGVGEEFLFRGAIQYWLGIWITTIIFILLHGYLNPKNMPLFIYGTALIFICAGFGYLMKYSGIYAAAFAHCIIDSMLMLYLKKNYSINYAQQA